MIEHEFTGRCPSKASIMKVARQALATDTFVVIRWGENQINIEKKFTPHYIGKPYYWGYGWIRRVGGDDLAKELNK